MAFIDPIFEKTKESEEVFEVDFVNKLATGETISSANVTISIPRVDTLVDVTSDLLKSGSAIVDGTKVQFVLQEDPSNVQKAGTYIILCEAVTDQGREIAKGVPVVIFEA